MIDGPGPPITRRRTGLPTARSPSMRWALILRLESDFTGPFDTHRILLLRTFDGGEKSG